MSSVSVEMLTIVAVLILVAVAAGTLTARLFIAASRTHMRGSGSQKEP
ncbi:MAG TPA: hypothetical protein VIN63_13210 [Candidatus Limnocylindria bacterium]|jgi:hypothetical protein